MNDADKILKSDIEHFNARLNAEQDARRLDGQLREAVDKQPRYLDASGEDWIDEFARTATPEEFRGAMKFTIGKYERRLGKKDPLPKELRKMGDYYLRWAAVEEKYLS